MVGSLWSWLKYPDKIYWIDCDEIIPFFLSRHFGTNTWWNWAIVIQWQATSAVSPSVDISSDFYVQCFVVTKHLLSSPRHAVRGNMFLQAAGGKMSLFLFIDATSLILDLSFNCPHHSLSKISPQLSQMYIAAGHTYDSTCETGKVAKILTLHREAHPCSLEGC